MHAQDLPLADARALIERAIAKAGHIGARGGFAVVGASGVLISASRMDRGGAGGMARARSKTWISATQQSPSTVHHNRMRTLPPPIAAGFVACSPEASFPGAGGMPIADRDGVVVAGFSASGMSQPGQSILRPTSHGAASAGWRPVRPLVLTGWSDFQGDEPDAADTRLIPES